MTTWTGEQDNHQKQREDQNRLRAIGPNLGDYTQWVRVRAPTGSKVSRLEEGDKETNQAILGTQPESRGLHPAGTQVYLREAEPSDLRKARMKIKVMKIRTDCKQSVRISGTTPSGCACAHPLEESSTEWRKRLKEKAEKSRKSVLRGCDQLAGDLGS